MSLAILLVAGAALLWAVVDGVTGGFAVGTSWFRVSSHSALRPFLAAVILAGIYAARYRRHWRTDAGVLAGLPWPRIIAGVCTAAAFVIGVEWGTFIGGGPDASGYVSQADKWVKGDVTAPVPEWAQHARWENAVGSSAPVGYIPDPQKKRFVPVYSPGFPLVMALFERIGGRDAVFYVVPLFGSLAVWATYLLGRRLGGSWAGAIAAVLMLASPPFLSMLVLPMSDIPVSACWTGAILLAWPARTRDAVFSALATAAAILIRPNLVPLTVIPALLLLTARASRLRRLVIFGLAVIPAALLIATFNSRWYGSPLNSGYGTLQSLYSFDRVMPNVKLYGSWFLAAQTPLAFLWLTAPFVVLAERARWIRMTVVTVAYPVAVFAMYATYLSWDNWSYLRFLLPAFPAVCAGLGAVFATFARDVRPRSMALTAVAAVTISMAIQEWTFAGKGGVFQEADGDRRFARAVDFANGLPANAILISNAYSGTLRLYTGRDVLRWGMIIPHEFDGALVYLRDGGHPLYFVGDPFEEKAFKDYLYRTDAAQRFDKSRVQDQGYGFVASDLTPP
jgi:hypothetical protein